MSKKILQERTNDSEYVPPTQEEQVAIEKGAPGVKPISFPDQKFSLGVVGFTKNVHERHVKKRGIKLLDYLHRHASGDWGDISDDDKEDNDQSLETDAPLFSKYVTKFGDELWIITEADRSATSVITPDDY